MSRVLQSDQINELVAALSRAHKKISHALQDSNNPHFNSDFASLESVINAIKPALLEENIVMVQQPTIDDGERVLVTTLAHASGQWMRSYTEILNEKKTCQSMGSGISYARRYAQAAMAWIGQADDDGNAATDDASIGKGSDGNGEENVKSENGAAKVKPGARSPEDFIFGFGKYETRRLGSIPIEDSISYYKYLVGQAKKDNKPINYMVKAFGEALDAYKKKLEANNG